MVYLRFGIINLIFNDLFEISNVKILRFGNLHGEKMQIQFFGTRLRIKMRYICIINPGKILRTINFYFNLGL